MAMVNVSGRLLCCVCVDLLLCFVVGVVGGTDERAMCNGNISKVSGTMETRTYMVQDYIRIPLCILYEDILGRFIGRSTVGRSRNARDNSPDVC